MALKLKFDTYGDETVYITQPPTFVLMTRSGERIGLIQPQDETVKSCLNAADEVSFHVYKNMDYNTTFLSQPNPPYNVGDTYLMNFENNAIVGFATAGRVVVGRDIVSYVCINPRYEGEFDMDDWAEGTSVAGDVWDRLTDFKLLWCKEWNKLFELYVDVEDGEGVVKYVTGTALGEAELGQIMLYDIQINTESDIARDDYEPTKFYDPFNPDASLLDRMIDKAPHYTINYVGESLMNLQRQFTFNNKSIYDSLQDVAKEIDCLFKIDCYLDADMNIVREISVYDLESNCSDCGHRGDFLDVCPECGSTNVTNGYGEDTGIFFSVDNLTDEIKYTTDVGSVKNCFKLVAGDDYMTAAIRSINPNGSDYIYYISDEVKSDMSDALVQRLEEYDQQYDYYYYDYVFNTTSFNAPYNQLVTKYNQAYSKSYQTIPNQIAGYPDITESYFYAEDFYGYLHDGLLPDISMSDTSAAIEAAKLTAVALSPVAVTNLTSASSATAENAVLSMAKVIVDTRYKVTASTESYANYVWTGTFTVTNYSDEEDTATTASVSVTINGDYETYVRQKIDKAMNRRMMLGDAQTDIVSLFKLGQTAFAEELEKYSLSALTNLRESCQTIIDLLIEQGIANSTSWASQSNNLYDNLYTPYLNKLRAIDAEMTLRSAEVDIASNAIDQLLSEMKSIQDTLDFRSYLGDTLWLEFVAYRREDEYQNSNYISDGLTNAEVIERAMEFVEMAKTDIVKSATLQHSISSTLANFLVMKEFQSLVDYFEPGNWIRTKIDNKVFKLRIMDYELAYSNLENLSVTFSDVMRNISGITDVSQILSQASSMATSYSAVTRQAQQGGRSYDTLDNWVADGLSLTTMKIVNAADEQNISWDDHGFLARRYDDVSETYDDKQLKIINNGLYVTDDNWVTSKAGIGEFTFVNPQTSLTETHYGVIADYLVGAHILGGDAYISNGDASINMDEDGLTVSSGSNTVKISPSSTYLLDVTSGSSHLLYLDGSGNLNITGVITATSGNIGGFQVDSTSIHTNGVAITSNADNSVGLSSSTFTRTIGGTSRSNLKFAIGSNFGVANDGTIYTSSANITGGSIRVSTSSSSTNTIYLQYTSGSTSRNTSMSPYSHAAAETSSYGSFNASMTSRGITLVNPSGAVGGQTIAELINNANNGGVLNLYKSGGSKPIALAAETGVITCVTCIQTSDENAKNSIVELNRQMSADFIYALTPVSFRYNDFQDGTHHGITTQNVSRQISNIYGDSDWAIVKRPNGEDFENNKQSYQALAYTELIADLIATVQSQNERISELEMRI